MSRELGWRLLDLRYSGDVLPPGVVPRGAIVTQLPTDELVRWILRMGAPVVRFGVAPHPKDRLVPVVMHDRAAMGRLAADHFFERGFRHVGFVGFDPWGPNKVIYDGLEARATELGCKCHLTRFLNESGVSQEQRYRRRQRQVAGWVRSVAQPMGLLGFVDGQAGQLCRMCADSGIVVPDEVAILGIGNFPLAGELARPTISSIAPDYDRKAEVGAHMLQQLMRGETLPETTVEIPPVGVVVRESTDVLATPDRDVAAALRYMWDQFDMDLSVGDVARKVGLPERTLTRRFRQSIGRSIIEELRRKRLAEAKRLLRTTDRSIADIAAEVGFRSDDYLHRTFKRAFGTTPRSYRLASKAAPPSQ